MNWRSGMAMTMRTAVFGLGCMTAGAAVVTFGVQYPKAEGTLEGTASAVPGPAPAVAAAATVVSAEGQTARRSGPNPHLEIIHRPDNNPAFNIGYVPAIKIKSGKIVWLSGNTALPTYHDHPHRRDVIEKTLPNDLAAQTKATMESIKMTLEAAGASFNDVVHMYIFRTRPRRGDMGIVSGIVDPYFGGHKPTSTNMAILELGEPEQLIEIQMFAVVD